jgi:hypothetical protein
MIQANAGKVVRPFVNYAKASLSVDVKNVTADSPMAVSDPRIQAGIEALLLEFAVAKSDSAKRARESAA